MSASRRDLLKLGLAGGVSALAPSVLAQTSNDQPLPSTEEIEKELGHPLPEDVKKLLKGALENNRNNALDRLKKKLPDCSEPCFVYRPTTAGGRK